MARAERETALTRGGALDALRFAAAAFIMIYHFGGEQAPRALAEVHPLFARGFLATDFFLILSGYILARAYGPRLQAGGVSTWSFLARRLARIWPAHLIVLCGFVAVVVAASVAGVSLNNPEAFSWDGLLRQAVFVHAWGFGPDPGWNSTTWTLSALVVCYALFPLIWRALSAAPPVAALMAGVGGVVVADLIARAFGVDLYTLPPAVGLGRGVPLFILGAAVARFGVALPPSRRLAWSLGLGGGAVLLASQLTPGLNFISMLALASVILAAGTHAPRRPSALVASAATISFALFVTHSLVGLVWFRALKLAPWTPSEPIAWVVWGLVLPVCVVAATGFHRWVDAPIQAWLKPRLAGRSPTSARARPPLTHPA